MILFNKTALISCTVVLATVSNLNFMLRMASSLNLKGAPIRIVEGNNIPCRSRTRIYDLITDTPNQTNKKMNGKIETN